MFYLYNLFISLSVLSEQLEKSVFMPVDANGFSVVVVSEQRQWFRVEISRKKAKGTWYYYVRIPNELIPAFLGLDPQTQSEDVIKHSLVVELREIEIDGVKRKALIYYKP